MKLYSKDNLKHRLDDIAARGRMPHAVLFSGNSGCGRKTLARYVAELFLCRERGCGECSDCRNIEHDSHPDVIFVKRTYGEKGEKYAIEPFREALRDTAVKPNNGDIKIYVFEDCDTMTPQIQNTLLKLIEEPPEHLRFVFTCENTSVIPETVMSRVTEFEVPDTSEEDCKRCLADMGADKKRAAELAATFAGNIGKAMSVLSEGDSSAEMKLIASAQRAAAAIGKRDGYGTAAALAEQTGRAEFAEAVRYLARILRDALALKVGGEAEFFCKKEARAIASEFSEAEIMNMLDAAFEIEKNEIYNLNLALSGVYFVSRIFGE